MIDLLRNLLGVLTPKQRKTYYLLQGLVVLTAVTEVLSLTAIGPFMALVGNIDLIESNKVVNSIYINTGFNSPMSFLFFSGLIVLCFLLVSSVISILTIWKLSYFAARTGAEIGDDLYEFYLKKDFLYHSRTTSAQLTKQIATEVSRVTDHVLQPLVQINARIVASCFISAAIFIYNPVISIIGLALLFTIYYILFVVVRGKLTENGAQISRVSKQRFTLMNEGFGAIKDVQLLGRQDNFIKKFKRSGELFSDSYGSSNGLYNTPRYLMEFIVYSGMIVLVLIQLKAHNGNLSETLPVLAIFGVAAFKLLPSFQQIYSGAAQIKSNLSAFYEIRSDLIEARQNKKQLIIRQDDFKITQGVIHLEKIYFRYPEKKNNALNGLSLTIQSNQIIGIVGASGSGKSTLVDIMLGLIFPDSGILSIDGQKVNSENSRSWQSRIGYVPQSIFLSDGNVIDNIAFGLDPDQVDMGKIEKAVTLSHLQDWVEALPNGLKTRVGERGVQLSGGQRQRIGIARALYSDADFLFFDEATSALDGITENIIMEAIVDISCKKTVVLIAHRLNTVKKCDLIFMIENGLIVDQGKYDYLYETNYTFKEMADGK